MYLPAKSDAIVLVFLVLCQFYFFIFSMCWCQVSLSIITQRYFALLLNSNGSPLIYTSNTFFLHAADKSKHKSFDLSKLSVSLFAFSQFAILSREVLKLFFNWLMFLFAQIKQCCVICKKVKCCNWIWFVYIINVYQKQKGLQPTP